MQFAELIENIPHSPGVYQMFDADGILLYVGKAKDLFNRLHQYVNTDKLPYNTKLMRRQVARVEFITTATESDALILESDLIKNRKPRYNILLTDDKMYPMLALTSDEFPRLVKFRGKSNQKRDVFGPYSSVSALNDTIKLIQKVCKIRTCTDSYMNNRSRPCLLHQIGRCSAPCALRTQSAECRVQSANNDDATALSYRESVAMARRILSGDTAKVAKELSEGMDAASDALDFESAAKIRDQIRALADTAGRGKKSAATGDYFAGDFSNGAPVIAIARVRDGAYLSHQIIYPKQTDGMSPSEIMEQTILWFYSENPPTVKIITNINTPLLKTVIPQTHKVGYAGSGPTQGIENANGNSDTLKTDQVPDNFASQNFRDDTISFRPNDSEIQKLLAQISAGRRVFGRTEVNWSESISELEKYLGIRINRADVFDNSHLFGTNPVGAMITFGPNGFMKKEYRHYKLKDDAAAGNDIKMMEEFISRRYKLTINNEQLTIKNTVDNKPFIANCSLLIIDGGKAQWNAAKRVLKKLDLDIPVLGVTKGDVRSGDERFILPDGRIDNGVPKDSKLFLLLRAVRDEAHRFAITFHKKTRAKSATASALDDIDGIGAARRRALLRHFGSVAGIAGANAAAIARVPGISKPAAEKIYSYFHPEVV